ncbi:hypothetical protein [Nocardioides sp. SYSU D00038]|uniref:hypothetical protein n=1 Tax=Nocardioides sp. SYSU D00038 TaxID=2812554 RepID=UPI001968024E|nr:hypothetical protein [Nocardioides sp. SYSU D00038]
MTEYVPYGSPVPPDDPDGSPGELPRDRPLPGEDDVVFVSTRYGEDDAERAELVRSIRVRLGEGERLLAVFAVAKISPPTDWVGVTTQRVVGGIRDELDDLQKSWWLQIPVTEIEDIEVTGFMDNVKFVHSGGEETKVGNLWGDDEDALRKAVRDAQTGTGPAAERSTPSTTAPAASYQVYEPPPE